MKIDAQETAELLKRLVAIDSVNPSLVAGARGEAAAAEFLCGWMRERGIAAQLEEVAPGRPNVVAWVELEGEAFRGQHSAVSQNKEEKPRAALAIIAHIDTVGAGDMREPFTPREREGKLYGRGALDIKSGVAAMCAAAAAVVRGEGSGERAEEKIRKQKVEIRREQTQAGRGVLIAAVVDEECNSLGTQALLERYAADAAVVLEPTDLKLCVAHKGYAWFEIATHGRAAHGSLPSEGRDAIRMMGRVLNVLDALDRKLAELEPHPLLGHASVHASLIEGGHELSSYPAECRLQLERRTLPGETGAQVEAELRALLESLRQRDAEFSASLKFIASRPPYEISPAAPVAVAAAGAIRAATGSAELCGMPFWTDTALLAAAGTPGIVFGPRGRGLHGAEECVELESVFQCAEALRRLILAYASGE